jgi:hypothetical protein
MQSTFLKFEINKLTSSMSHPQDILIFSCHMCSPPKMSSTWLPYHSGKMDAHSMLVLGKDTY